MDSKHKPYGLTSPCANCPFRTDIPAYLTPERVREIEASLVRSEFPCHKTTKHGDEDEDGSERYVRSGGEVHCAGALILMEKEGRSSQMMRIAERLRMYDPRTLKMGAPVFDSFDDMAEAQTPRTFKRTPKRKARRS